jgi:hypothetical protein
LPFRGSVELKRAGPLAGVVGQSLATGIAAMDARELAL